MTGAPIEAATNVVELLATYGPWAVVVLAVVAAVAVVWYVDKLTTKQVADMETIVAQKDTVITLKEEQIAEKDKMLLEVLEERHGQFVNILREVTNALTVASGTNEKLIELADELTKQYNLMQHTLNSK